MRNALIISCLFLFILTAEAQDIHFSQYSQTPLLLNPAAAGVYDGYYRGIVNYRNQWSVMGKPFTTFMGSYDMPFENKRNYYGAYIGLGIYAYFDKAGDAGYSTTQGNAALSCIVPIGEFSKFSAGLEAGISYRSLRLDAIQWPNQYNGHAYDPTLSSNETSNLGSSLYFDMATGIHYQYLKSETQFHGRDMIRFVIGGAFFHAAKLFMDNTDHVYPRIVIHTDLRYDLEGTRIGFVPSLLYMKQGKAFEVDAGILLRIKTGKETNFTGFLTESAFSFGLQYRYGDAFIPQIFFEVAGFGIGVSYDVNVSSFSNATGYNGGLEASIRYSRMRGALYKNMY